MEVSQAVILDLEKSWLFQVYTLDFVFLASVAIGTGWKIQAVDCLKLDRVVGKYFFNYIWTGP
jgi:hypothetical protein